MTRLLVALTLMRRASCPARGAELPMNTCLAPVLRFLADEDGPTAVEYAVMLAFIILVCIVIVRQLGFSTSRVFSTADSAIGTGS
jgi:pilus assembly protein Flp/PilA